jgi:hypothetical protein
LLPTASTAPRGAKSDGVIGAASLTVNSLIPDAFQIPALPLDIWLSEEKMKPQSSDSYQPKASGDHSKRWTLIGEGSREGGRGVRRIRARAWLVSSGFAFMVDEVEDDVKEFGGSWGPSSDRSVMMV